jgi:hypothetical protein
VLVSFHEKVVQQKLWDPLFAALDKTGLRDRLTILWAGTVSMGIIKAPTSEKYRQVQEL